MIKNVNRFLSMALCAALLFGMLPGMTAFAAEEETEAVVQETETDAETGETTEPVEDATEAPTEETTEEPTEALTEAPTEETNLEETIEETDPVEIQAELVPLADAPTSFAFECHERTVYLNTDNQNIGLNYAFQPEGTGEPIVKAESSDPSVLEVEIMDGWLQWHAYKVGTVTVTATTSSGLTDSCVVSVTAEAPTILLNEPVTVTVHPGDIVCFQFTPQETGNYAIYSEDSDCLVSLWMGYGQKDVQQLEAGETYGAKVWNNQDSDRTWTVTIKKAVPVGRVHLNIESPSFQERIENYEGKVGESIRLRAVTEPLWAQYEEWTWSTSDSSVASIDGSGNYRNVTLLKEGTATITVTMESGASASCVVSVNPIEAIHLGESKTLTLGYQEKASFRFIPEVSGKYVFHMPVGEFHWDAESNSGYNEEFSLSIVNPDVNYVSNGIYSGCYCTMEAGKEYILSAANYWDQPVEITGTVRIDEFKAPDSISIEREYQSHSYVESGFMLSLSVMCAPETAYTGNWVSNNPVWTSSNPDVLKLDTSYDNKAVFTSGQEGTATITVTADGGLTASRTFTVVEVSEYKEYEVLDVTQGDTMTVHIDGDLELFEYIFSYRLDDMEGTWSEVNPANYSVTQGSTIVTLHKDYLDSLPEGKYGLDIYFFDGYCHTDFEIGGSLLGDVNGDKELNEDDSLYLILHLSMPEMFPLSADGDVNCDGTVNEDDASYFILYLSMPELFPLYPNT